MRKNADLVISCALLTIFALSCQKGDVAEERARRAAKPTGEIRIAAVGSWGLDNDEAKSLNGMEMAVEEINKKGGIQGRRLLLVKKDDQGTLDGSLLAAEEIAGNPDIAAVIGHTASFSTLSCSAIYEAKGLLQVSPLAKNPELLERNNKLIIDVQVKADRAAKYLAELARDRNYRAIAISYVNDDYGARFATDFEKAAAGCGIKIIDAVPHSPEGTESFAALIAKWEKYDFDALLYAGHHLDAAAFIIKVRQGGIRQPILTDTAFTESAVAKSGKYLDGVITVVYFDTDPEARTAREFIKAYRAKYRLSPTRYSANGYEAVHLLAEGIRKAGSTESAKVATALRTVKDWQGISGKYRIREDGGVEGKPVLLLEFRNGKRVRLSVRGN